MANEQKPIVNRIHITLHIDSGNLIHETFESAEEAKAFLRMYHRNPQAILEKITPKKRSSQASEDIPPDSAAS